MSRPQAFVEFWLIYGTGCLPLDKKKRKNIVSDNILKNIWVDS